ncbi:gp2 [Mycobacterium phage PLot]|uniref:Uncharacterized protein n=1 Tax=Mycobacterium phage PLot TaxID=373411 RepID=Q19YE7_9CAUD|nr:gp2 [Mycobacterium phage PLot]ABD58601.1 hypothetical protein PBI_PLOT_2 [Mycobacterium phage PLot]
MPRGDTTKELTDRTVGKPDGPEEFRPEFGIKVGTFTMRRKDLDHPNYRSMPCLMFHVPLQFRGHYRVERLANFSGDPDDYRIDNHGYRLCEAETPRRPTGCLKRASNRQPYCEQHGARLHPLDKVRVDPKDPSTMTRMELLAHGYIDVEDLTDDELKNGLVAPGRGGNAMIHLPKDVYTKIVNRHFDRAKELMLEGMIPAIKVLRDIAENKHDIYEAKDRVKAATYILDRVLGKQPDTALVLGGADGGAQEPWQQIVAGIMDNTRAESRAARALPSGGDGATLNHNGEAEEVLDVEVVEESAADHDSATPRTPDDTGPDASALIAAVAPNAKPKRAKAKASAGTGGTSGTSGKPAKVRVKRPKRDAR